MHIIIEGLDKTGKSTLARELSKRLYYPVINKFVPKKNIFIECIDTLSFEQSYIIDRIHISEQVYGPIKRGASKFDIRQYRLIELYMLSLGTFNIFCNDGLANIAGRFVTDREEYAKVEEIKPLHAGYEREIRNSILNWHEYHIGDSIDELAEKIKKHFTLEVKERASFSRETRSVGSYDAEVMLIGEKYGDKLLPPLIPFGNNDPGLKLFEALESFDLRNISLTNAFKYGFLDKANRQALEAELARPGLKKVICLGNNAYDYVRSVYNFAHQPDLFGEVPKGNLIIKKITHPSGFFVYQGGTVLEYSELIKDIIQHD